jgi:hypothetical protein
MSAYVPVCAVVSEAAVSTTAGAPPMKIHLLLALAAT